MASYSMKSETASWLFRTSQRKPPPPKKKAVPYRVSKSHISALKDFFPSTDPHQGAKTAESEEIQVIQVLYTLFDSPQAQAFHQLYSYVLHTVTVAMPLKFWPTINAMSPSLLQDQQPATITQPANETRVGLDPILPSLRLEPLLSLPRSHFLLFLVLPTVAHKRNLVHVFGL